MITKEIATETSLILMQGIDSIASSDMKKAEERALEFIQLRKEAEKKGMAQAVENAMAEFKAGLTKKKLKQLDEFEVMCTLLAIENPFERWKVLGEMISDKWPKGVSAVEAIREQRE